MPKRNSVKVYGAPHYYHLYNRGVDRQNIFGDPEDYFFFLSLFKRHLSDTPDTDSSGRVYADFSNEVELVAFCLMPNHFHLLVFLKEPQGIVHLTRSVMTAYTMYFNKKYKRSGGLYEGAFLASPINSDVYLWHVSRYIHQNPRDLGYDYRKYPYSSMQYYSGRLQADWLSIQRLVETDKDRKEYLQFVADYQTMNAELDHLKQILASES